MLTSNGTCQVGFELLALVYYHGSGYFTLVFVL